ncbi:LAQU0S01e02960g1_1 [Lachancea quebecensis]|uniref:LAQU0S01e02960g1_1 n=1 Tax=Lachancea quebecensis TaxID=1654605 RepID=A0A0P1KUS8_9SACH|nr:LAQU0S01e02960g1_1 [Lachancea quebecensis]
MNAVDESFRELVGCSKLSPLEISELLSKIHSAVFTEGVSASILNEVIEFLCESPLISTSTKIYLVREALFPNGPVQSSTVLTIISHLGVRSFTNTRKQETHRDIQIELCKWLVHVFVLTDDVNVYLRTYSIWFQLWKFDYLQKWVTYILFWATTADVVRPWRVQWLLKTSLKTGYTNSKALATLLLEKFNVAKPSQAIVDAISSIQSNRRRLKSLEYDLYDDSFLSTWSRVLIHSKFISKQAFFDLINDHRQQIHIVSMRLRAGELCQFPTVPLNGIETIEKLVSSYHYTTPPKNVEEVLPNGDRTAMIYLALLDRQDPFWSRCLKWCEVRLKSEVLGSRNDPERTQETMKTVMLALALYHNDFSVSDELLTENRITNLLKQTDSQSPFFHVALFLVSPMIHVGAATSRGLAEGLRPVSELGVFYERCRNTLYFMWACVDILADRSFLHKLSTDFENMLRLINKDSSSCSSNRHVNMALRLLVKVFSAVLLRQKHMPHWHISSFYKLFGVLMISNDPLVLCSVVEFFSKSRAYVQEHSKDETLVKLHNRAVLDATNYLWRNKFQNNISFIGIPSEFINKIVESLYSEDSEMSLKSWLTITSVPAVSYCCYQILRGFEKATNSKAFFNHLLTHKGYDIFKEQVSSEDWLDTIPTYYDLKLTILARMRYDNTYRSIPEFLFTFLKSLTETKKMI